MGDADPIRTLGDYFKTSHKGYKNTIELPVGNNVVPLRSETIRLVQNECSFYELWSEDPNQHLKDFLKLVDSLDLDGENRERTRLLQIFYDHVNPVTRRTIDQSTGGKLRDRNAEESWALLEDLTLYDNESWNDPKDFAKPVKAISLPQDVPSTSDRRLIDLEYQVQCLMEAHLAPTLPTRVNKITTSCEIFSGPHDTQYCMEDPEQAFVEYTSLRSLPSDTVKNPKLSISPVLSARSYPTEDPQCSTLIHGSINAVTIHPKHQSNFHDDEPAESEEKEKDSPKNTNTNPFASPDPSVSFITEKVQKLNSFFESFSLAPQLSGIEFVCTKGDDGDVMFIKIVKKNDDSRKEEPEAGGLEVEYFDMFPT
ncbi:hypothetical protein Tco_0093291 [Tanacetum coccineum]